jgi:DNA-binding SARP family transcriptional activator
VDEFRLLGPVEAMVDGTPVRLAAAKPRALLALLLLARNRVVATERLIDELWGDEPPAQATKTLQVYVSQLRKSLGPERLVTQPPGYLLRVEPGELDLERFEQLAAEARTLPPAEARDTLSRALALWRGAPEPVAGHLEELRGAAYEEWLRASVESGDAVVPQLEELVAREPLRSRCTGPGARPRRSRSSGAPASCSSTSWGSSRARSCASSSRRCCARTPTSG